MFNFAQKKKKKKKIKTTEMPFLNLSDWQKYKNLTTNC